MTDQTASPPVSRDLSLTLLLLLATASVFGGLALGIAGTTEDLIGLPLAILAIVAATVGWALDRFGLPRWTLLPIALVLGLEAALTYGALTNSLPEWAVIPEEWADLRREVTALLMAVRMWVPMLLEGESPADPQGVALVWAMVVWLASIWGGWASGAISQPLWGLLPAGALLSFVLFRAGELERLGPLLLFLAGSLTVVILRVSNSRERSWRAARVEMGSHIRSDLLKWSMPLVLILSTVASLVPAVSLEDIVDLWPKETIVVVVPPWGRSPSVGPLAPAAASFDEVRQPGLPRGHLVGQREEELSEHLVMEITTDELRPGLLEVPRRYYWRALAYDQYDGHGWSAGYVQLVEHEPREEITTDNLPYHEVVRQEVTLITGTTGLVHSAGPLLTVNRDASVGLRLPRPPRDLFGTFVEYATYRVESLVSVATEEQLRLSSTEYPDWIRERYLALPGDLPQRVIDLAVGLTEGQPTPYDQAQSIEAYLRLYPYTTDVPLPPPDQDAVDFFLFDLQQGYCDYYATAMVVLSRAAGLPARLVVGYTSGAYDPDNARFLVSAADAHAWAEVYMPPFGWIEFEPTGGRPTLARPGESAPNRATDQELVSSQPEVEGLAETPPLYELPRASLGDHWYLFGLGLLVVVVGAGALWWESDKRRIGAMIPGEAVRATYQRLRRYGRFISVPMQPGDTPYEFGRNLEGHLAGLWRGRLWDRALAPAIDELRQLVGLHVAFSYAPRRPDLRDKWAAVRLWDRLRLRLVLAKLWPRSR